MNDNRMPLTIIEYDRLLSRSPEGEEWSVVTIIASRPRPVPDRKLVTNKGLRHVTAGHTLELLCFRYGLHGCTRP